MNITVTTTAGMKKVSGVYSVDSETTESGNLISVTLKDAEGSMIAFFSGHSFICWQKE